jgi:soluble lytic murein transglycosylase-like protein
LFLAIIAFFSQINYSNASENQCKNAIIHYEELYQIPKGLLGAISKIESASNPLALGDGVNIYNLKTKEALLTKIKSFVAKDKTNFDVGCMQLNYYWHHKNFTSLEEMIDVKANVRYASSYLFSLYKQEGSWHKAVRFYHSRDPNYNRKYSRKVTLAWIGENSL